METVGPTPFYDLSAWRRTCCPFVISAHESSQDRVIIGPSRFAENQVHLFDWLYRDVTPAMRLPAFRLGRTLDSVIAARIYPIDLQETISSRRDGVVVVGLAVQHGSPAALCDRLGLIVRQIAAIVAKEELSVPGDSEAGLMALLGQAVAQSSLAFDWSIRAQLALDLSNEIPSLARLWPTRRLWPWKRHRLFAALLDNRASTALQFRVASEFWRRGGGADITVAFDDRAAESGAARLLYQLGGLTRSPLTVLEGRDVRMGQATIKFFHRSGAAPNLR